MKLYIVSFVFVTCYWELGVGQLTPHTDLTCLKCDDIQHPSQCTSTEICGAGEACYVREYTDGSGVSAFRLGCESRAVCNAYHSAQTIFGRRALPGPCMSCCTSDTCNNVPCSSLAFGTVPVPTQGEVCPPGFVHYRQSCYYFTNTPETWSNALDSCHKFDADLVKVEDEMEDYFIVSQLKKLPLKADVDGYWTGGHEVNHKWVWTDNTSLEYTRWATGEPDKQNSDIYMAYIRPEKWYSNFEWASHNAYMSGSVYHACGFICERPVLS